MRIVIGEGSCGIAAGAAKVHAALEACSKEGTPLEIGITGCIGMCFLEPIVDLYEGDNLSAVLSVLRLRTPPVSRRPYGRGISPKSMRSRLTLRTRRFSISKPALPCAIAASSTPRASMPIALSGDMRPCRMSCTI